MNIHREEFIIPGHQGKSILADIHYPLDQTECQLVIYAHGINGFKDWGGMEIIARQFARAGYAFLKFNFSHNGTTPAQPCQFADPEAYGQDNYSIRQQELNLISAYTLKPNIFPFRVAGISLIGHSRGGTDALLNTRSNGRINQLITWSAPAYATTPWRNWDKEKMQQWRDEGVVYLENKRTGQQLPLYYQLYEDYRQNKQAYSVEMAARELSIPWLICHGEEDEAVFIKDAYDLKSWQPQANIKIIANTGHTYGRSHPWEEENLPAPSQELVEHCLDFIQSYQ